jgi:hypothetical protein
VQKSKKLPTRFFDFFFYLKRVNINMSLIIISVKHQPVITTWSFCHQAWQVGRLGMMMRSAQSLRSGTMLLSPYVRQVNPYGQKFIFPTENIFDIRC